jgi:phenylalanyl-tRNA synthetase alpha chain
MEALNLENVLLEIETLKNSVKEEINKCSGEGQLLAVQVKYLGRKSYLVSLTKKIKDLPDNIKPRVGKAINETKEYITKLLEEKKSEFSLSEKRKTRGSYDYTLPPRPFPIGHRHPITQTIKEIVEIFKTLGFSVYESNEIESDYYNFEALNIPQNHPARDMHDTFYLNLANPDKPAEKLLLRTHTSPGQIHIMEKLTPPIYVIIPGKVYRYEDIDTSHLPMFHQVEGLAVDKHITFCDLKSVLYIFIKSIFSEITDKEISIRFRPSYFPFVEPGVEVDMSCVFCAGSSRECNVCKNTGYLELLGAGMVHPEVFRHVGYDPESITGFAFGMGVERLAMLKYGIQDIRAFYENDIRFLEQF